MTTKELELEKLKDWFRDKYDWECYKKAERELDIRLFEKYNILKRLYFLFFGVPEKERIWLMNRTDYLLRKKWEERKR